MHQDDIVDRVARDVGIPDLVEVLSRRIAPTDLQSLLLVVYRRRSAELTPSVLLERYGRNAFTQPSQTDPGLLLELDRIGYGLLPEDWELVELAPVCPLGTSSVLGKLSQDRAVATVRNTEVMSDSTNVLALECARRRRAVRTAGGDLAAAAPVKLCTSARLLRSQPFEEPFLPHFRLFALVSAGRDTGSYRFELAAAVEHIDLYLRILGETRSLGVAPDRLEVSLTSLGVPEAALETEVVAPLSQRHPHVTFGVDPERQAGRGYYTGLCFWIHGTVAAGSRLQLVDGGGTDWTQLLLSDGKERLLISGLGSELLCAQGAST